VTALPPHATADRLAVVPTTADLLERPELGLRLAPEAAAEMLAKFEGAAAVLRVAALAGPRNSVQTDSADSHGGPGRWLTPDAAAALACVPRRVVYGWSRRADWRAFTHRLSRKVLRIEDQGFRRWLERQPPR